MFTALATVRLHFAVQLHGMAATLETICDMIHTFILADARADEPEDREYWFTCPAKEKVGAMKFDQLADRASPTRRPLYDPALSTFNPPGRFTPADPRFFAGSSDGRTIAKK